MTYVNHLRFAPGDPDLPDDFPDSNASPTSKSGREPAGARTGVTCTSVRLRTSTTSYASHDAEQDDRYWIVEKMGEFQAVAYHVDPRARFENLS